MKQIKIIEKKFADFPLAALTDRRTRGVFMAWRDELALRSRRQADSMPVAAIEVEVMLPDGL